MVVRGKKGGIFVSSVNSVDRETDVYMSTSVMSNELKESWVPSTNLSDLRDLFEGSVSA